MPSRVYRIRSGNVLGKWLRILAIDIFLREQKGARWNIKRSPRLIANGNHPSVSTTSTHSNLPPPPSSATGVHNHPPIYGAFCTFDIFYCRSPLFVLFMFLLGTTLGSPFAVSALAWPASTLPHPPSAKCRVHSRAKFTPYGYGRSTGHWIFPRICSRCKRAAILKRYIFAEA